MPLPNSATSGEDQNGNDLVPPLDEAVLQAMYHGNLGSPGADLHEIRPSPGGGL